MPDLVLVEHDDHIATVTINRPEALNAMNLEVFAALHAVFAELGENRHIRVIILTGAGDRAFVAGADIAAMRDLTIEEMRHFMMTGHEMCAAIETAPQIVIAAVNGYALGGGTEIALACDLRIAAEKAKFGLPEVTLGIIPGLGGTQRLPRLVGKGNAKYLISTGEHIDAAEALRIGLVNRVVPSGELMNAAKELASAIAKNGPAAVSLAKRAIDDGLEEDLVDGLKLELEAEERAFATSDRHEGLSAFLERRPARFRSEFPYRR